ncbi:MAG: hypothetical protein J7453_09370 [Thermomicrobium sp.]|nr:hypothetical protein [Thermomicrobium sp.]
MHEAPATGSGAGEPHRHASLRMRAEQPTPYLFGTPLDAILHRRGWRSGDSLVVRWLGAFEEWFGGSVETGTTYPSVSLE